jgi:fructose-1,6-bisphosphatase/inositol monophosphatase family enzyme
MQPSEHKQASERKQLGGQQDSPNIDVSQIPKRKLYTDDEIPVVGLGTFGSDAVSAEQIANAVRGAAELGYRHFDCAAVYGNEKEVGAALKDVMASGIAREDLWITSKLWNDKHAEMMLSQRLKRACVTWVSSTLTFTSSTGLSRIITHQA